MSKPSYGDAAIPRTAIAIDLTNPSYQDIGKNPGGKNQKHHYLLQPLSPSIKTITQTSNGLPVFPQQNVVTEASTPHINPNPLNHNVCGGF